MFDIFFEIFRHFRRKTDIIGENDCRIFAKFLKGDSTGRRIGKEYIKNVSDGRVCKVDAVSVDIDGGYVDTDKDNIFVSLAPYFLPLWMLVWMAILFVANWIYPFEAYLPWFYAGFGFWWSFHVYWTLWVIPREQPDLIENEVVFSFMIIMLANIAFLLLVLRCFGVITFHGYLADFKACAIEIYTSYSELLVWLWQLI